MPSRALFVEDRGVELMQAARVLVSQLELDEVLTSLLEAASRFTGAGYAAIEVLDQERSGLERSIVRSSTSAGAATTPGLSVPIVLHDTAWGNLHLAEKPTGPFEQADRDAAAILAEWATIAVANARTYQESERRREALEKTVSALEVTSDISRAVGGELDLDRVLALVVERGRALVRAQTLTIGLVDGDDVIVAAMAGRRESIDVGVRVPRHGTLTDAVAHSGRSVRIDAGDPQMDRLREAHGMPRMRSALLVPMAFRGEVLGVLAAFDRDAPNPRFSPEDERLLNAFAATAATAVATARSAIDARVRAVLEAEEHERRRWARELHDDTLQDLAALNLELAALHEQTDDPQLQLGLERAMRQAERQVASLRGLITELRPAGLADLGLGPAVAALADRVQRDGAMTVTADVSTAHDRGERPERLHPDLEAAAYRLIQEALTNVARHARATTATVTVHEDGPVLHVEVIDDGQGFDLGTSHGGFGLIGMRERVELLGGTLEITSGPRGTAVHAALPVRHAMTSMSEDGARA